MSLWEVSTPRWRLAHETPGRIRFRSDLPLPLERAEAFLREVEALPGILEARWNRRTGSLLVLHEGEEPREGLFGLLGVPCPCAPEGTPPRRSSPGGPESILACHGIRRLLRYLFVRPFLPVPVRVALAARRSLPYLRTGLRSLSRGRLGVEVLDATAIGVSLARGDLRSAGTITFLLSLGEALDDWTRKKTRESLARSLVLDVESLWVRRGEEERHIPLGALQEGDEVVVRTGGAIPVDGVVLRGEGLVNQASMTGEPLGILRGPGDSVFAGTVLEEGTLYLRATDVGDRARLSQIVRFLEESESRKASIQGRVERLSDAVVPFSFLLAALVWTVTRDPVRTASVLVVDYSCAVRLATPLALLSAMREGNGRGVLVKGGRFLEALAEADTVVFDKTGTLTEARPQVEAVLPLGGHSEAGVLRLAACLEEHFPHPVARAVVHRAEEEGLEHREEHAEVEYVVAHGVASRFREQRALIGSRHFVHDDEGIPVLPEEEALERTWADAGCSLLYLALGDRVAGLLAIRDPLRPAAGSVVAGLRDRGFRKVLLVTGDGPRSAAAVAAALGIDQVRSEVLPACKAEVVEELKGRGHRVVMVGDGVNDSPALSASHAGVALQDGADLTREVADVVLTRARLEDLLVARDLSVRVLERIRRQFGAIVALNTLFLAGGLFGVLTPALSATLHNLTTLGAALGALRPLLPPEKG